ncbi:predicted protein [Plenodomus lingam JN3]|uniref:Uncharacterized protein n=1 Tax=Leptosphaeria maculans (strain JN3 / isolate v23.1.3 / race Av1-4-5-6-7-8) TaxID=985895 RepID=E4ZGR0_LEPMJ|nr:predicted protein [Plenodomus lingam JN3]CBX90480.1 predicted protein [Plenodomus lingam JN3]
MSATSDAPTAMTDVLGTCPHLHSTAQRHRPLLTTATLPLFNTPSPNLVVSSTAHKLPSQPRSSKSVSTWHPSRRQCWRLTNLTATWPVHCGYQRVLTIDSLLQYYCDGTPFVEPTTSPEEWGHYPQANIHFWGKPSQGKAILCDTAVSMLSSEQSATTSWNAARNFGHPLLYIRCLSTVKDRL